MLNAAIEQYEVNISDNLQMISGLKFQPIVDLTTKKIIGKEVLTVLSSGSPDTFFETLPLRLHNDYLKWQIKECSHKNAAFWFNVTVDFFINHNFIEAMRKIKNRQWIWIEIQDPEKFLRISSNDKMRIEKNVRYLQTLGVKTVIDDLTAAILTAFPAFDVMFDAVKIDRSELNSSGLKNLIAESHRLSDLVVIEGIETLAQLDLAIAVGADAGQGYYWQQEVLPLEDYLF